MDYYLQMNSATIIFPHQLFEQHPSLKNSDVIYLVEEFLFFNQYRFHKQKLAFHRASMKFYNSFLSQKGFKVVYIEAGEKLSDVRILIKHLGENGIEKIHVAEITDNWLEKRIDKISTECGIKVHKYDTPGFLNTKREVQQYFTDFKKHSQTKFYIHQRKKFGLLLTKSKKPVGGKWSYDAQNRLKYPIKDPTPEIKYPAENSFTKEAFRYVNKHWSNNYGNLSQPFIYPVTFSESKKWLNQFLLKRFEKFGIYEDAIVTEESILHHSLLSPLLNSGLLTPKYVLDKTIRYAKKSNIPLNSTEGFIRQIIGWREFIRGIYEVLGAQQRTNNFWNFTRKIPSGFWNGKTGIEPLDIVINKVLKTGYCHHIERLMVLGNFMLLCEFDPDEVYEWFMKLFIDSYDWVMVPNVYGMSQFADGGLMSTKPYISGSNYLIKMSDYKKGEWQLIWDGLFWRFMDKHRIFFRSNPRMGMLVKTFDRMTENKKQKLINSAESYLQSLS